MKKIVFHSYIPHHESPIHNSLCGYEVCDVIAVHKELPTDSNRKPKEWALTHIPTGARLTSGFGTREEATAFGLRVREFTIINWFETAAVKVLPQNFTVEEFNDVGNSNMTAAECEIELVTAKIKNQKRS